MSARLSLLVELPQGLDDLGGNISGLRCPDVEIVVATDDARLDRWPGVVRVAPGSGALDRAVAAATAPAVAVADPGGKLDGTRLDALLEAVHGTEGTGVAYSDERVAGSIVRKPGWSPLFYSHLDYCGRLTVFPRSLVAAAGGFGDAPEGTHRLLLRLAEARVPIRHVAEVAYCRPVAYPISISTPSDAGRLPAPAVSVSILMPTAGRRAKDGRSPSCLAHRAADAVYRAADGLNVEILCIAGPEADMAAVQDLVDGSRSLARLIHDRRRFNFSHRMNLAAAMAQGEVLIWLNDDVERHKDDRWLRGIVRQALVPDVGAVGLKLLYPDGTVQTAGVRFNAGFPKHVGVGVEAELDGPLRAFVTPREQIAVTGAVLATRRSVYEEVGGLTKSLPVNFGDVDYCLKLRAKGYRVVLDPTLTLLHQESASRPPGLVAAEEFAELLERWPAVNDEYWPWPDEANRRSTATAHGQED